MKYLKRNVDGLEKGPRIGLFSELLATVGRVFKHRVSKRVTELDDVPVLLQDLHMSSANPYYNTSSISDPELFFNRSTAIETLLNYLFSGSPQCLSIIGQRKIGKTSLVQHLSRPTTLQQFNHVGHNYLFVYFDCQMHSYALGGREDFYRELLNHVHSNIPDQFQDTLASLSIESGGNHAGQKWDIFLRELAKKNVYIIVIFDEFDKAIIQEALIKEGLFGSLRGYAQHNSNFAWITCTKRPLYDLFEEIFDEYGISKIQRASESDFYNIAIPYTVGLFDKADAIKLVTCPAESRGVTFTSEDIEAIIRFGGNFPYFIQRVCYRFFDAHLEGDLDREAILQQCVAESRQHWKGYWSKLKVKQQEILISIANEQFTETRAHSYEFESLKEAALVYEDDDGKIKPFSEEFGRFVLSLSKNFQIITTLEKGQHLNNRYEIIESIGQTNHSYVVKARDERLNRVVAIKLLHMNRELDDAIAQKLGKSLQREAQIVANLDHPHIGRVYDVVLEPLMVIMHWIEGSSLQDIIDGDKPISHTTVVNIGIELADALSHAHREGVIHRDIKPSNIILTGDNDSKVVLIDFDIASASGYETISSVLGDGTRRYIGTPLYSAPEQLQKESVGPPADLFSLGVVLYELLTRQLPYKFGNNPASYEGDFPQPAQLGISDSLYSILCRLLSRYPTERRDAKNLQEELQRYRDSL